MRKEVYYREYSVELKEDGTCEISRFYFLSLISYAIHKIQKKDVTIRVSPTGIDLDSVELAVDRNKNILIRGQVNHTLVGFLR
jgi:hypothetical protein